MTRSPSAFTALFFLIVCTGAAQSPPARPAGEEAFDWLEKKILANAAVPAVRPTAFSKAASASGDLPNVILLYRFLKDTEAVEATNPLLVAIQETRTDHQVGAADSSQGSTSLAAKGGVPAILGFAVENGALARAVSGTTVTFRGTPLGLIKALEGKGLVEMHKELQSDSTLMALAKLSFSFSFDTNRGETPGTFVADKQQLSSYGFRYEIINRRDPRDRRYDTAWRATIADATTFTMAVERVRTLIESNASLTTWNQGVEKSLLAFDKQGPTEPVLKQFRAELRAELDKLDSLPKADLAALDEELLNMRSSLERVIVSRKQVFALALKGPLVTVEFTNTRDPLLPDLFRFQLIGQSRIGNRADVTGNFAASFFRTSGRLPAGSSKWRDLHAAGQVDVPLGGIQKFGSFVLTFAGRWEYLPNDTRTPSSVNLLATDSIFAGAQPIVDPTGLLITPKGNIGIFQTKLTIPVSGSGVKIPLSFTASNRTELIKEKDVRLNVGITLDLDTIFSKK
jgi:hypothetical protein